MLRKLSLMQKNRFLIKKHVSINALLKLVLKGTI